MNNDTKIASREVKALFTCNKTIPTIKKDLLCQRDAYPEILIIYVFDLNLSIRKPYIREEIRPKMARHLGMARHLCATNLLCVGYLFRPHERKKNLS